MDLQIRGNDFVVTPEIQAIAIRHSNRLDHLIDRIDDAKLELRRQSQRNGGEVTVAQITVHTRRSTLRAEERDRDATKAVDTAFDKLERQIRKFHEKKVDRFGRRPAAADDEAADTRSEPDEESDAIVRTKRFQVKPMDIDEAIEQMELLGHDFFLFQNTDAKAINLIYRRRDGRLGLLVPEPM